MAYSEAANTKLSAGGLNIFEDRLQNCHKTCDSISQTLSQVEERLFNPRPAPVGPPIEGAATKSSIEGTLHHLASRLHDIETLAARILQG